MQNQGGQMNGGQMPAPTAPMRNKMRGDAPSGGGGSEAFFARTIANQPKARSGWQATFDQKNRLSFMMRLFTLITTSSANNAQARPSQWQTMLEASVKMETNIFQNTSDPSAYNNALQQKMTEVANLARQSKQGLMQPPPVMNQQQLQNPMTMNGQNPHQGPQTPMLPMNINPNTLQQMPSNPQAMFQPGQPMHQQFQQQMQQPQRNMPQNQQAVGRPSFTQQEQSQVMELAKVMLTEAARQGTLENIKRHIGGMPPEQRNRLAANGQDPVQAWFKQKALQRFMSRRQGRNGGMPQGQQQQQKPTQFQPSQPPQQSMMHDLNQNQMMGQAHERQETGRGNLSFDPSQFAGLQERAMRSQASGDMVVPASNNRMAAAQQANFTGGPNQQSQTFRPPNGPVRRPGPGQLPPNNNGQNDQAAARARAQAQLNQGNHPPQRTPQQDRLQGQGLHSSQPGIPSPMSTLNRPLQQDQQALRTPQQNPARPDPSSGASMGHTSHLQPPRPSSRQQAQPNAQRGVQTALAQLPLQLQNFYHALPDQLRNRMSGMEATQLSQALISVFQKSRQSQMNGQTSQQQRLPNLNAQPNQDGAFEPGMQMVGQAGPQPPQMPPQDPNCLPNQNQRPLNALSQDSMPLPRQMIQQRVPELQIPPFISNWTNLKQWLAGHNNLTQPQRAHLGSIQREQAVHMEQQQQRSNLPTLQDLLSDPNFLHTPQIDLGNISQRHLVQTGLVPVDPNSGFPQLPRASQDDVLNASRKFTQWMGRPPNEVGQFVQKKKLEQLRQVDEQLWREIQRVEANVRAQNGHTLNPPQPGAMAGNSMPPQHSKQGRPIHPPTAQQPMMQQPLNGAQSSIVPNGTLPGVGAASRASKGPGQGLDQPGNVAKRPPQSMNAPGPSNERRGQMSAAEKQKEAIRLQAMSGQAPSVPDGNQSQPSTLDQLPPQLLQEFNQLYERIKAQVRAEQLNAVSPAEGEQYRHEVQNSNLPNLMKSLQWCAKYFYARCNKGANRHQAMVILSTTLLAAERVKAQDYQNHRYSFSLPEFQSFLAQVRKFVPMVMKQRQDEQAAEQARAQGQEQQQPATVHQEEKKQARPAPSTRRSSRSNSNVPPPAPTSEKPPLQGFMSPRGEPRYGNNTFDTSKLTIPQKRKKQQQAADESKPSPPAQQPSPPAQQPSQPSAQIRMKQLTEAPQHPPVNTQLAFKCPIPHCEHELAGFATQAEADEHAKAVHGYKGDELDWCLDMLRGALNLNATGQPNKASAGANNDSTTAPNKGDPAGEDENAPLFVPPGEDASTAFCARQQKNKEQSAASNKSTKPSPRDPWAQSNVSQATLTHLFQDLPDFPSRGLEAFAGLKPRPATFSADTPGLTVEQLAAKGREREEAEKADKREREGPLETTYLKLEDYDPFDPYGGKDVVILPPTPGEEEIKEPMTFDEAMADTWDMDKMKQRQLKKMEEDEKKRKERDCDWVTDLDIDAFLYGDDQGKSEKMDIDVGQTNDATQDIDAGQSNDAAQDVDVGESQDAVQAVEETELSEKGSGKHSMTDADEGEGQCEETSPKKAKISP